MQPDLSTLIAELDLPTIAAPYLDKFRRANGNRYEACCPFHQDTNPSFSIFFSRERNRWWWNCLSADCGSGDAGHFIARIEGLDNKELYQKLLANAGAMPSQPRPLPARPPRPKEPEQEKPPLLESVVQASLNHYGRNPFCRFLSTLSGKPEEAAALMRRYRAGFDAQAGQTLFYHTDLEGRTWKVQAMKFDSTTGKSLPVKEWFDKETQKQVTLKAITPKWSEGQPPHLFGAHLLKGSDRPVCVVESAKNALVGAMFFPAFDWVATFGAGNSELLAQLKGLDKNRPFRLLGDQDKKGKALNSEGAAKLREMGFKDVAAKEVSDFTGGLQWPDKTDIADVVIYYQASRMQVAIPPPCQPIQVSTPEPTAAPVATAEHPAAPEDPTEPDSDEDRAFSLMVYFCPEAYEWAKELGGINPATEKPYNLVNPFKVQPPAPKETTPPKAQKPPLSRRFNPERVRARALEILSDQNQYSRARIEALLMEGKADHAAAAQGFEAFMEAEAIEQVHGKDLYYLAGGTPF